MMPSVRSLRRRPARQDNPAAISAGYGHTAKQNEYSRRESRAMILPRRPRRMVLILWGWTKEPRASLPAESRESFERVLRSLREK
jgi:hypothetical protein